MRQWVTTFPRRVRYHLAADPKLASAALREVLRAVFTYQRRTARQLGEKPSRANSNGAVTFIQRFNSALELSLHFHALIPDGVFISDGDDPDARPRFVQLDPPTTEEVAALLDRLIDRVLAMLRKHGRLDDDNDNDIADDPPEPHLLLAARPAKSGSELIADDLPPRCARKDGFSLHAASGVHANDRLGLERLARYGLRPPLALGRLAQDPDGTLRYEMKRRFSDGRKVLTFAPRDFLLRLCALVPPPRCHTVRYAGIFAAHARGRHALTGRGMRNRPPACPQSASAHPAPTMPTAAPAASAPTSTASSSSVATPSGSHLPSALPDATIGPDDPARARRLEWSRLMKRSYAVDVLVCPKCSGPMRLVALIDDGLVAKKILDHLGISSRAPPRGPPRRPGQQLLDLDYHAEADAAAPPYIDA